MENINWSEDFSVGDNSIDEQHKKIISLINQLIEYHTDSANREIIAKVMNELVEYSQFHLNYEEKLLEELQYPELSQHKELHLKYLNGVSDLSSEIWGFDHKEITHRVLKFLKEWWSNHILKEDMQYKAFLKKDS